jgi:uncharacterized protein
MEKLSANTNALNWFEIPVTDMPRAQQFYQTIFAIEMYPMAMPDMKDMQMLVFPSQGEKVGGALVKSSMHKPSMEGTIVYLNGNPDLQAVLDRIEEAGGQILVPKTQISPEIGYMAFFRDTEGNAVALHSQQ